MFHPSSNRLAGFLEISATTISLARSGGAQFKAGYLRIESDRFIGGGFGRKSAGWTAKKTDKWCAVRESYIIAVEEPGEVLIYSIFPFPWSAHLVSACRLGCLPSGWGVYY